MNGDALLYQEEHGEIEEPEETPGEKRDRIRRELNEIHLLKLKQFTPADLVRELAGRKGVTVLYAHEDGFVNIETQASDTPVWVDGPATALVVRGEI